MAKKSKSQLITAIATFLTGTPGNITAAKLRTFLSDLLDSLISASKWEITVGYLGTDGNVSGSTVTIASRSDHVHVNWPEAPNEDDIPFFDLPSGYTLARVFDGFGAWTESDFTKLSSQQRWKGSPDTVGSALGLAIHIE